MRRQTSKARRILEWRFQNSRCSTLSEGFVKSLWRTVRLKEILKNRTLKSVDGLLITEDSGQFIRTSCQKKECFVHLDYMFDTKSETWISEMVRYWIFQHFWQLANCVQVIAITYTSSHYLQRNYRKRLIFKYNQQANSWERILTMLVQHYQICCILYVSIYVTDICLLFSLLVLTVASSFFRVIVASFLGIFLPRMV